LINKLKLDNWKLWPMQHGSLDDPNLGSKLTDALNRARALANSSPVVFLGMDSPELPLDELHAALNLPETALLCPAADGGYGMLSVPESAPISIFKGVQWSNPLTALSQLKALSDANVITKLGRLMYDIDEPQDVEKLCERLLRKEMPVTIHDVLIRSSAGNSSRTGTCTHTIQVLKQMKQLEGLPKTT
jgi:glycosyltransferase A (GT-A) superfamily protein (DUF2064 family)